MEDIGKINNERKYMDIIRVLRILEYVGPRDKVEDTLKRCMVPINGSRGYGEQGVTIHSAIVGNFPEILNKPAPKPMKGFLTEDPFACCLDCGEIVQVIDRERHLEFCTHSKPKVNEYLDKETGFFKNRECSVCHEFPVNQKLHRKGCKYDPS
jgi:hypothetical protein